MVLRRRRRARRPRFIRNIRRSFRRRGRYPKTKQRGLIVADKQIVHLKYVDNLNITSLFPLNQRNYNINSLFDPDRTGVGTRPVGFVPWLTFYNRYRVFACSAKIMVTSNDANNGVVACMVVNNDAPAYLTLQEVLSNPRTISRPMQRDGAVVTMRRHYNLPRVMGRTSVQYKTADSTQALTTASPSELCVLSAVFATMDGVNPADVNMCIELTFHAELFDRHTLPVA